MDVCQINNACLSLGYVYTYPLFFVPAQTRKNLSSLSAQLRLLSKRKKGTQDSFMQSAMVTTLQHNTIGATSHMVYST